MLFTDVEHSLEEHRLFTKFLKTHKIKPIKNVVKNISITILASAASNNKFHAQSS